MSFEILGEVPWLFDIMWHLPATDDLHVFELEGLAGEMMTVWRDNQGPYNDIGHLLGERSPHPIHLTDGELAVDGCFAITAGSDSAASVMAFLVYFLTCNPDKLGRLRKELEDAFPEGKPMTHGTLSAPPYLNAMVDESLRLGTPFPGLPRVVPRGGIVIDGVKVPGGTIISVPAYTQQTSAENFSPNPEEFIPERWISSEYETNLETVELIAQQAPSVVSAEISPSKNCAIHARISS
ncbi:cytochrome P450 [Mycena maculata]|uniref:Cytochrome P450 n=1 Tax=Mycena maculata TaxID=230809 RepID=A0AAD7JXA6_9AGAR|nr:cytochrome P450 [Mycena maculata]